MVTSTTSFSPLVAPKSEPISMTSQYSPHGTEGCRTSALSEALRNSDSDHSSSFLSGSLPPTNHHGSTTFSQARLSSSIDGYPRAPFLSSKQQSCDLLSSMPEFNLPETENSLSMSLGNTNSNTTGSSSMKYYGSLRESAFSLRNHDHHHRRHIMGMGNVGVGGRQQERNNDRRIQQQQQQTMAYSYPNRPSVFSLSASISNNANHDNLVGENPLLRGRDDDDNGRIVNDDNSYPEEEQQADIDDIGMMSCSLTAMDILTRINNEPQHSKTPRSTGTERGGAAVVVDNTRTGTSSFSPRDVVDGFNRDDDPPSAAINNENLVNNGLQSRGSVDEEKEEEHDDMNPDTFEAFDFELGE